MVDVLPSDCYRCGVVSPRTIESIERSIEREKHVITINNYLHKSLIHHRPVFYALTWSNRSVPSVRARFVLGHASVHFWWHVNYTIVVLRRRLGPRRMTSAIIIIFTLFLRSIHRCSVFGERQRAIIEFTRMSERRTMNAKTEYKCLFFRSAASPWRMMRVRCVGTRYHGIVYGKF